MLGSFGQYPRKKTQYIYVYLNSLLVKRKFFKITFEQFFKSKVDCLKQTEIMGMQNVDGKVLEYDKPILIIVTSDSDKSRKKNKSRDTLLKYEIDEH